MACVYVGGGGERGNYVSVMGSCMCIECVCGRGEINTKCARTVVTHLQKLWLLARGPLVRTDEPSGGNNTIQHHQHSSPAPSHATARTKYPPILLAIPSILSVSSLCCEGMEQKELVSLSPSPHQGPSKSVASNTCDLIGQCKHLWKVHTQREG